MITRFARPDSVIGPVGMGSAGEGTVVDMIVVAHRGASVAKKENTLAAFLAAGEMGAAMVELDVRRTRDWHMVVHHDAPVDFETKIPR